MSGFSWVIVVITLVLSFKVSGCINHFEGSTNRYLESSSSLIELITKISTPVPNAVALVFQQGYAPSGKFIREMLNAPRPWGIGIYEIYSQDEDGNSTSLDSSIVIASARQFRRLSWNALVVLVSESETFVRSFARDSLAGRLLVWSSKLLLVTSLPLHLLQEIMTNYWTFSMMNAMILNYEQTLDSLRWSIYTHMPYTPEGQQFVRLGYWSPETKLETITHLRFFPDKYDNFHGSTINITALTYAPYWTTLRIENPDGTISETYKGTDARLLNAIAGALNFKFYNIPTQSWDEVAQKVTERTSFMATVFHFVFPNRMDRYDYSYAYEFASMAFTASKPALVPKWQSLYYPLANTVWLSTLSVLVIVPAWLYLVNKVGYTYNREKKIEHGFIAEVIFGTLLSQPLSKLLPKTSSIRVLMAGWLVFAFIIGTAYRGNLTASLTLPKYPPRAETIEDLIKMIDKVISPPYGAEFRDFFKNSDSAEFQTLAQLMDVGPNVLEGLRRSSVNNEAYMDGKRYIEQNIAEHFTRLDGGTNLYVGRENVLPGLAAWPIPFDAPFRPQLDGLMMAVLEGGLYEKWSSDTLEEARLESQRRQKDALKELAAKEGRPPTDGAEIGSQIRALTVTHMQGPFLILGFGLILAAGSLAAEVLVNK